MFCRVMFLRCCSLLETVLWGCVGAVSDQCAKFDDTLGAESRAMSPSVICPDTVQWPAWFNVVLMFLVGILVLCSAFYWGRLFVDAAMRMPRFQPFVVHALLVASLVSLVLFLQWPVTFEVMLPSPFVWFIVMLMILVGILVGLLSAFSWGRSFVDAAMRVPRFQFLVIAAVLAASLVSLVLFVSFGSALSLVWRCPIFLQFTMMVSLCLVCSRARLVLGCFGSGQAKDKKFSGKRVLRYLLICCKICLPIQVCGTYAAAYVEEFTRSQASQQPHAKKRSYGDLRVLQLAWNTWRSRRVCTCPHHLAVRHRKGFHCYACNGPLGLLLHW